MTASITTRPAVAADAAAVTALHARVFGPGRFARTAYRVREGASHSATPPCSPFCRIAERGDRLVAALKMTPIAVGGEDHALMLGPLVVDPEFAGQGYGRGLVAESLDAARVRGIALVILVGDEPYYGPLGFKPVPAGHIAMPGPVNPQRLLAAELQDGALARFRGLVTAA